MSPQNPVELTRYNDWLVAAWLGDIDMSNASSVQQRTVGALDNTDKGLTVDLSRVSYLDSAGIRALITIRRLLAQRQQRLNAVVPDGSLITKALEVAGVPKLIPIFPTAAGARPEPVA